MTAKATLMRWGAYSTFAAMIVFVGMLIMIQVKGGLDWPGWIPWFCVFTCLYVGFLIAGYEYLAETHFAHARVGFAFGVLLIIVLFVEVAAWSANRMLQAADAASGGDGLVPMIALYTGTHSLAIWFHGLWFGFWGAAFIRMTGRARVVGGLMLAFAAFYLVFYVLLRISYAAQAEWAHSAGHICMVISNWLLGLMMLKASRRLDQPG